TANLSSSGAFKIAISSADDIRLTHTSMDASSSSPVNSGVFGSAHFSKGTVTGRVTVKLRFTGFAAVNAPLAYSCSMSMFLRRVGGAREGAARRPLRPPRNRQVVAGIHSGSPDT